MFHVFIHVTKFKVWWLIMINHFVVLVNNLCSIFLKSNDLRLSTFLDEFNLFLWAYSSIILEERMTKLNWSIEMSVSFHSTGWFVRWAQLLQVVNRLVEQSPCLREFFFSGVIEIRAALQNFSQEVNLRLFFQSSESKFGDTRNATWCSGTVWKCPFVKILFIGFRFCTISFSFDEEHLKGSDTFIGEDIKAL